MLFRCVFQHQIYHLNYTTYTMSSFRADALESELEQDYDLTSDELAGFFTPRQFAYYADERRCGLSSLKEARQRMGAIAECRIDYGASVNGCHLCTPEHRVHTIYTLGQGKTPNQSVLWIVPAHARDTSTEHVCRHLLHALDECFSKSDSVVIVFDFQDYSYGHVMSNTTLTYHISKWLQSWLLDRVDAILLLNPPRYLQPVVYMAKTVVGAPLQSKLFTVYSSTDAEDEGDEGDTDHVKKNEIDNVDETDYEGYEYDADNNHKSKVFIDSYISSSQLEFVQSLCRNRPKEEEEEEEQEEE